MRAAAPRGGGGPRTAVVAACQGHRCRALLGSGLETLRRAAARSERGVLLSTACLGTCAHGPVAAVGTGRHDGGTLHVTTQAVLGPLAAHEVSALQEWFGPATDVPLPAVLDAVRLWPPHP